ncbi:MAG TPA: aromatic acid exporter family protein, partial [Verrucomicrobiae bacterium]|nr:aromatic acid exporter family protein [Verrucomicrobiae bacterium]
MNIGARILKTGLAVMLAISTCKILHVEPAVFAAITVVVNMQPSVRKALRNAGEQLSIHLLGVALAVVVGYLLGTSPVVIGLAVVLMIMACNRLGWSGAISLGIVSVVFVLDSPPEQFLVHAGVRSLAVFIGLAVALLVNRLLAPPRYRERYLESVQVLFQETATYFLISVDNFIHSGTLQSFVVDEPVGLKDKLEQASQMYEHAREEFTQKDNLAFNDRMLGLCRGFLERGQNINDMAAQRVKRRNEPDSPLQGEGVSQEFQKILDILNLGKVKLQDLVNKLAVGMRDNYSFGHFYDDVEYWEEFDAAMDDWQRKVSGF